ncbi:MAG: TonB-dependent receptor plug domain-containing protein [Pseudohongiellaceae bacterium]
MPFNFRRNALFISLAAISMAAVSATQAQVTGSEPDDEAITTIFVREVLPSNLLNTPGAASRLTDEEIAALRPYTLHDAFDFMPGVRTIDDDVLGRRSAIGVRGAPSRRSRKTLLLEDGTPINFSAYLDPSAHYTPPMERLANVDVLKGAGHVKYGPLNNHGIVNFRNKQPTQIPETTLDLAAGDLDTFKRHLMHRRTDGDLGLVFSYTGADAEGSFDIEDFRYDDYYASAVWDINEQHQLDGSLTYFRERSHYDESNLTPQEYAVAPRTKRGRFAQEYNTFALNYVKADLSHDYRINSQLTMTTRLFGIDADRPRFTVEPEEIVVDALPAIELEDPENAFIPGVQGLMLSRDRYYRTYGAESGLQSRGHVFGNLDHTFQWGLRAERHFLNDQRSEGSPGEILKESHRGAKTRDDAYQTTAISTFLQDVISYDDWLITPGIRVENYTQSRNRRSIANDPGPHDPREEDENFLVLPSISVLYDGINNTQIFANLARGYTPAFARPASGFPLDPETGINTQLGIRSNRISGLTLESAVFYNRISDTIVQLPFSSNDMNIVLNSADSKSYGIDFGGRLESSGFVQSTYNFFAQLAYNFTRAEFTEDHMETGIDGNRVPEIPLHAGSLTFGLEHNSGWHVSVTASHFGDFYTDPLNTRTLTLADEDREPVGPGDELEIREPAVLGQVPGHTVLSARISYALPDQDITVWAQGRNLNDKLYIADLENGIRPGAERTFVAGVTWRF